ncbi:MAG: DsbA family protein [Alphaproteobacteria bacterium]|nr:DsbA family protein [Alphaproteobacteria bacterium]
MEEIVKKISSTLSLIVMFFLSAVIYFNYKGFVYENGTVVLKKQIADAAEYNGIAVVLPKDIAINVSQKYAVGSASAPLTMFEYSSLTCPHCADFHLDIMPFIVREYVDKGLLRVIFVNFPLDKNSMKAALLSECMTYDNYAGFLNELFYNQRSWWMDDKDERLLRYAAQFDLSYDEAQACIKDKKKAADIVTTRHEALKQLNMQGTPAFLISGADGNEIIYGAVNYSSFKEYLDSRLIRLHN